MSLYSSQDPKIDTFEKYTGQYNITYFATLFTVYLGRKVFKILCI